MVSPSRHGPLPTRAASRRFLEQSVCCSCDLLVPLVDCSYNLLVVDFDPAKEAINIAKHGISLTRFEDMVDQTFTEDVRHSQDEARYLVFGQIDGALHAAVITYRAGGLRVISLRRASRKERRIYG